MRTKYDLLDELESEDLLVDPKVEDAFIAVDIEPFLPSEFHEIAYTDRPLPFYIRGDRARTISAPHMIAIMLQMLDLKPGDRVLQLGAKSGYIAALIANMIGEEAGEVVIVESNPEIYGLTAANIVDTRWHQFVDVKLGNPLEGWPAGAPWDRILVTGQIEEVPSRLIEQLARGGVLLAPVGEERAQKFISIQHEEGKIVESELGSVIFGPLIFPVEDEWPRKTHEMLDMGAEVEVEVEAEAETETETDEGLYTEIEIGEEAVPRPSGGAPGAKSLAELSPTMAEISDSGQKRAVYRSVLDFVWSDGVVADKEAGLLNELRETLGITESEHIELERTLQERKDAATQPPTRHVPAIVIEKFEEIDPALFPDLLADDLEALHAAVKKEDPVPVSDAFTRIIQYDPTTEGTKGMKGMEGTEGTERAAEVDDDALTLAKVLAYILTDRNEEAMGLLDRFDTLPLEDPLGSATAKLLLHALSHKLRETIKRLHKLEFTFDEYGDEFSNTDRIKHLIEHERLSNFRDEYKRRIGSYAEALLERNPHDRTALGAMLFIEY